MNIPRKIELASQHVLSISRHDDEDMAVRNAALDRLTEVIETEKAGMAERVQVRVDAALAPPAKQ